MMLRPRTLLSIRIIIWLIPIAVLAWIVEQNLASFRTIALQCRPTPCSPLIRLIEQDERGSQGLIQRAGERVEPLSIAQPLTLDLALWRPMKRATVRLTYKEPDHPQRIELGVNANGSSQAIGNLLQFNYLSLANEQWFVLREGGRALLTRNDREVAQFETIEKFFSDLPNPKKIARFNVDLPTFVGMPRPAQAESRFQKISRPFVINTSIRGPHTLLLPVARGEPFDLKLTTQDINRHRGKDDVSITVYRDAEVIVNTIIPDDGDGRRSGVSSQPRDFRIFLPSATEGYYRIEMKSKKDDPFIHSIESQQRYIMFERRLYPAGSSEYREFGSIEPNPLTVYVKGTRLSVRTSHTNSLQTITVGSTKLNLTERKKLYTADLPNDNDLIPITIPTRDIYLETDGIFVLSPEQYFADPRTRIVPLTKLSNGAGYDYILARDTSPELKEKLWFIAEKSIEPLPPETNFSFSFTGDPPLKMEAMNLKSEGLRSNLKENH